MRIVNAESIVEFLAITILEDDQSFMWVGGLADGARLIVQGQDFVREGQKVEAVSTAPHTAQR